VGYAALAQAFRETPVTAQHGALAPMSAGHAAST